VKANYGVSLAFTLREEGGVSDVQGDPGGLTFQGITLSTLQRYIPAATPDDLRDIGPNTVSWIYRSGYWDKVCGDELPAGLDLIVFDAGVNSGPSRAVTELQAILGVPEDGDIGPITLKAIASRPLVPLIGSFADSRRAYYENLDHFEMFGRGWLARLGRASEAAIKLASGDSPG
jgi:lysozyme family protein